MILLFALTPSLVFAGPAVTIPGLAALGFSYTAKKNRFDVSNADRHATDNHILDIQLLNLSRVQYDQLIQWIPGGHQPKFVEGGNYRLADFLPELLGAVEGYQFEPMEEKFKWPKLAAIPEDELDVEQADVIRWGREGRPLATLINCWTTVYEFLRTWKQPSPEIDITWLSRSMATQVLTQTHMDKIANSELLRFGDVIVFSMHDEGPQEDLVQHAAIHILPGLYFEKTDSSGDDAFRFILESDLLRKYREIAGGKITSAHYRLKHGAVLPRLLESRSLWGEREYWARYFSKKDLRTISMEFDWEPSLSGISKPRFAPYRIHSVAVASLGCEAMLWWRKAATRHFRRPRYRD